MADEHEMRLANIEAALRLAEQRVAVLDDWRRYHIEAHNRDEQRMDALRSGQDVRRGRDMVLMFAVTLGGTASIGVVVQILSEVLR